MASALSPSLQPSWKCSIHQSLKDKNRFDGTLQIFMANAEKTLAIRMKTLEMNSKKDNVLIQQQRVKIADLESQLAGNPPSLILALNEDLNIGKEEPLSISIIPPQNKDKNTQSLNLENHSKIYSDIPLVIREDYGEVKELQEENEALKRSVAHLEGDIGQYNKKINETKKSKEGRHPKEELTAHKLSLPLDIEQKLLRTIKDLENKINAYEATLYKQSEEEMSRGLVESLKMKEKIQSITKERDEAQQKNLLLKEKLKKYWGKAKHLESQMQQSDEGVLDVGSIIPQKIFSHFIAHATNINACSISKDGKVLATAGADNQACIWNTETWHTLVTPIPAKDQIGCIKVSSSGTYVAFGSNDHGARLFDFTKQKIRTLSGHTGSVLAVDFSNDDLKLLTGSRDRTIRIWDRGSSSFTSSVLPCHSGCKTILVTGDHTFASGHIDGNIRLWDFRERKATDTLSGIHGNSITSLSRSLSEYTVLAASSDNTMSLIDLRTTQVVQKFEDSTFISNSSKACLSPDGRYAVRGSDNGGLFFWNCYTGNVCKKIEEKENVSTVHWNTALGLVTCTEGGTVIVRSD